MYNIYNMYNIYTYIICIIYIYVYLYLPSKLAIYLSVFASIFVSISSYFYLYLYPSILYLYTVTLFPLQNWPKERGSIAIAEAIAGATPPEEDGEEVQQRWGKCTLQCVIKLGKLGNPYEHMGNIWEDLLNMEILMANLLPHGSWKQRS